MVIACIYAKMAVRPALLASIKPQDAPPTAGSIKPRDASPTVGSPTVGPTPTPNPAETKKADTEHTEPPPEKEHQEADASTSEERNSGNKKVGRVRQQIKFKRVAVTSTETSAKVQHIEMERVQGGVGPSTSR